MRPVFLALALAAATAFPSTAQDQPTRLALVIGNADYNDNGALETSEIDAATAAEDGFAFDLSNAINDGAMIRTELQALGYVVDYHTNLDRAEMLAALEAFSERAAAAPPTAKVIIYYAGHSFDFGDAMYLVPVGAQFPQSNAPFETREAQTLIAELSVQITNVLRGMRPAAAPGFNLFVFDSCRTTPWRVRDTLDSSLTQYLGGSGSSPILDLIGRENRMPSRSVVVYAAVYGRTAADGTNGNSPFALALRAQLASHEQSVTQSLIAVATNVRTNTDNQQLPYYGGQRVWDACIAECAPGYPIIPREVRRQQQRNRR